MEKLIFELIHYGEYLTNENIHTWNGNWIRIMNIKYNGQVWCYIMQNGQTKELKRIC